MQDIRIRITGDPSALDPTIQKLEKLGQVDDANSKKFKQSHEEFKKQTHEKEGLVERFGTGVERKMERIGEFVIAAFATERIVEFGKECVKAFEEAEQQAHKLEFAVTKINGATHKAFEDLIEQSEQLSASLNNLYTPKQIQAAQTALAQFGLTTKEIKQLTPRLTDFAKVLGVSLPEAANTAIRALGGQATRGELKLLGASFKDTGTITGNFNKLLEETAKVSGAAADSMGGLAEQSLQTSNKIELLQESIGSKLAPQWEGFKKNILETTNDLLNFFDAAKKVEEQQKKDESSVGVVFEGRSLKQLEKQKDFIRQQLQLLKDAQEQIKEISGGAGENPENDPIFKDNIRKIELFEAGLRVVKKKIGDFYEGEENRDKDLTLKGEADREAANKKRLEDLEKTWKEAIAISERYSEAQGKIEAAANKKRIEDAFKENKLLMDETQKAIDEINKEQKRGNDDVRKLMQDDVQNKIFDLEQERDKILDNITLTQYEKEKIISSYEKKITDIIQEETDKRNKEALDSIQTFVDEAAKLYESAIKNQTDAIDHQQQLTAQSMQVQAALAAGGKANILAEEQKHQSDLEAQRMKYQRQLIKIKELEILLNAIANFSEKDPKGSILRAVGLLAAVKGAEAQYMEEGGLIGESQRMSQIALGKLHPGGGDVLVHAQTGEGMLSRKDIANMGGKQVFLDFKNMLKNPLNEMTIPNGAIMFGFLSTTALEKKVDNLTQVMANKPETSFAYDSRGNLIITTRRGGIVDTIVHNNKITKI